MSADDIVAIAEFPDGFRVVHTQCIENITYHKAGNKEWHKTLDDYFGKAKCYKTNAECFQEALRLEKKAIDDMGFPEYGIGSLGFFDHKFK